MGWYGRLTQLFRKKKPTTQTKGDMGVSKYPSVRTAATIKRLKEMGLSDKEISRLTSGRE